MEIGGTLFQTRGVRGFVVEVKKRLRALGSLLPYSMMKDALFAKVYSIVQSWTWLLGTFA